jgi:hypothetical protein
MMATDRTAPKPYLPEGSYCPVETPAGVRLFRVLKSSRTRTVLVPITGAEAVALRAHVDAAVEYHEQARPWWRRLISRRHA